MRTFFDYDKIECVEVAIAKDTYPLLHWSKIIPRFAWGMGDDQDVNVLTLADLNICITLDKLGTNLDDYNYSDIVHCSVCRRVLLPDDEAYNDENSGDVLCTHHSIQNEVTGNYVKIVF
tara:strand:+ start:8926 stop:9282 length:357 start_codon:yes stop_codon:yes gene_type:complete